MDLGLSGKHAIVCGASKGLGLGCARALAAEGVNIVLVARSAEPLAQLVDSLRSDYPVGVEGVAADLSTLEGRDKVLAACPAPDILVANAGGPPVKD